MEVSVFQAQTHGAGAASVSTSFSADNFVDGGSCFCEPRVSIPGRARGRALIVTINKLNVDIIPERGAFKSPPKV